MRVTWPFGRRASMGMAGAAVAGGAAALALFLSGGPSSPANDRLASASPVTHDLLVGTTAGASADPMAVKKGYTPPAHRAVWYRWTAPASGSTEVTPAAAGPSPAVSVFTARQPAAEPAPAPAEAAPAAAGPTDLAPTGTSSGAVTTFDAVKGRTYFVEVSSPQALAESFRLVLVPPSAAGLTGPRGAGGVALPATDTGPDVSCGNPPGGWSPGPVSIACTATSAVGLAEPSDATFDLTASIPDGSEAADVYTDTRQVCDTDGACVTAGPVGGIDLDRRGPIVACDPVPTGWSGTDVTITCGATDGGSGLVQAGQASQSFTTAVPAGQARSVSLPAIKVCDSVGNCTSAGPFGPIKVDKTTPVASCGSGPAGWVGHEVSITCAVTDAGSGLAEPTQSSVTLATQVGKGNYDADASTNTVNVCSVVEACIKVGPVSGFKIDEAPPLVSCTPPSAWSVGPAVPVPCEAVDDGAGLAAGTASSFELTADPPSGTQSDEVTTGTRQVCDAVGNCATAGPVGHVKVDEAAPAVDCDPAPARWSAGPTVTIRCSAYDTGSGLKDPSDGDFTLSATTAPGTSTADASTGTRRVCSALGICATAGPVSGIRIDRTTPAVDCARPPSGVLSINVMVRCTAADAGSGLEQASDASFLLATNVGPKVDDARARTDSRRVCSRAGTCVNAGPFDADVDRDLAPTGGPPVIGTPSRATVVLASADEPTGSGLSYPVPPAHDALGEPLPTICSPGPSAPLHIGWSVVTCSAIDGAGRQTVAGFPLLVEVDPSLAPAGPGAAGGLWRLSGIGYAPGSALTATFDGQALAQGRADSTGVASFTAALPATAGNGSHELALAGTDPQGDPLTEVVPVTTRIVGPVGPGGAALPGPQTDAVASGSPAVPPRGATLPAAPAGAPVIPKPSHFVVAAQGTGHHPASGGRLWLLLLLVVVVAAAAAVVVTRLRRTKPLRPPPA